MDAVREGLYAIVAEQHPATVRAVFYQAVSRGLVAKTEGEYKSTVGRLLVQMRREGIIPFSWIADNTRWMRKPRTYTSMEEMLKITAQTYRRALWANQEDYVEIWLEKEALAGTIVDVTEGFDVPLLVTRGYPSTSYLSVAAEVIAEVNKPTFVYYLGDRDPSGVDIPRVVERGLREFAPEVDITFKVLAVLPEQIEELALPTRPTKKTDSRSRSFHGESVEVDAIPAPILRAMVRDAIVSHIDADEWNRLVDVEEAERETLTCWAEGWSA